MPLALLVLVIILLLLLPNFWVGALMKRHQKEREDIPGTGAELARHLIRRLKLEGVEVETSDQGDHYDPEDFRVRLLPANHDGRSLTAVAIAAHEVSHALQHQRKERAFLLRGKLAKMANRIERYGSFAILTLPLVVAITRHPLPSGAYALLILAALSASAITHLVTLPVELDASFNKALPILREGGYIAPRDEAVVRQILRAAAFTYVAASLAGLLNVWRWARLMRR
jgi:Zn-dependent membrane protease YugP